MDDVIDKILNKVRCSSIHSENQCASNKWKAEIAEFLNSLSPEEKELLILPLTSFLRSDNTYERSNAVYVLGALGTQARSAVPAIVQAVNCVPVIQQAIVALPKIDPEQAMPELAKAIPLLPQNLQGLIIDWLGNAGTSAVRFLLPHLVTDPGWAVSKALKKIGPVAIPAILQAVEQANLESNDRNERMLPSNAARVLSEYGSVSVQPVIDAISSSSGRKRDAVLSMIRSLKPPALSDEMLPLLYRLFVDALNSGPRNDVSQIWQAFDALGMSALPYYCEAFGSTNLQAWKILQLNIHIRRAGAIPVLMTSMSHANSAVQANAAAVLLKVTSEAVQRMDSNIGDPEPLQVPAVEKLVALLSDNDEQVRLVALEALATASEKCNYSPVLKLPAALLAILKDARSPVWQQADPESGDIGKRTFDAFGELIKSGCLSQSEQPPKADAAEVSLPSIPTFDFIKQVLERELAQSVVAAWGDNQPEEVVGQPDFSARRLEQPLGAGCFGQPTFFNKHIVIEVSIRGYLFKPPGERFGRLCGLWHPTPSSFWSGSTNLLYAYDGKRLYHLGGASAKGNISEVFRAEALKLDQADPVELAWFFCHTVVPGSHTVVEPAEGSDQDSAVTSPSVIVTEGSGWKVHFWTLHSHGGCCPSMPTLCEHTVDVSPRFDITYTER